MPQQKSIDIDKLAAEIATRIIALPDLSVPSVRQVRQEISKRIASAAPLQVLELALVVTSESILPWFAYELVHYHKPALGSLDAATLERWGQGLDSWGTVDSFAVYLAGPAWRERQVLPDSLIHGWARSEDRWWRRAALVCTVALNNKARGGRGRPPRTIEICGCWPTTPTIWW